MTLTNIQYTVVVVVLKEHIITSWMERQGGGGRQMTYEEKKWKNEVKLTILFIILFKETYFSKGVFTKINLASSCDKGKEDVILF